MTLPTKDRIIIMVEVDRFPAKAFELAIRLSVAHEKGVTLLHLSTPKEDQSNADVILTEWVKQYSSMLQQPLDYQILIDTGETDIQTDFTEFMEEYEQRAVIFELDSNGRYRNCKKALKLCRQLRIPYYFVKPNQIIDYKRVLVPVGFLVEEREKGVFSSGMGRFFQSEILLMTANDYGSRAKENTEGIKTLLDKFNIKYCDVEAKKNSFKVEIEAVKRTEELNAGLLLISASREYGMDDIIFGPKEQKVVDKSTVPVMVINPRKDLYALCD